MLFCWSYCRRIESYRVRNILTMTVFSAVYRKHGIKWWDTFILILLLHGVVTFLCSGLIRFTVNTVSRAPSLEPSSLCPGVQYLYNIVCRNQVQDTSDYKVILRLKLDIQHMQCFILRPRCLTWNGSLAGRYKGRQYSPCWVRFVVEWHKWHPLLCDMRINELRFAIQLVTKAIVTPLSWDVKISCTVEVRNAYNICVAKSWSRRRPLAMPGRR